MDSTVENSNSKRQLVLTSFALYFCYIAYGLAYNIWGPTWVDLVNLLDSTQDAMAYGNSLMAIGYTIGAFSGGFIFNYLNRQLLVAFYLLLMAAATTLTPIFKSYNIFLIVSVIFGLGEGGFDTACNAWILEMWKDENGPYMQALHFTFGVGSLLAPLISIKFLDDSNDFNTKSFINSTKSHKNMMSTHSQIGAHHHNYIYSHKLMPMMPKINETLISVKSNATIEKISHIWIPYSITGGLLVVSALIIVVMYIIKKYEPITDEESDTTSECSSNSLSRIEDEDNEKLLNNIDKHDNNNVSRQYLVSMVIIGGTMFCFYEGMENINFEYLSTFNVNTKLNLSEETSALMVSAMSAAYTIGRGVGIVLSMKLEPKYFLYTDLFLITIANAIMYFYANTSETMLIIGVVILGFGFSTVFPCIYSYMEQHIRLTNFICGILMVSCASIATIDPIIVGRYIKYEPYILLYVNIGSTILVLISFLSIEISAAVRKHKQNIKHHSRHRPSNPSISGFRP